MTKSSLDEIRQRFDNEVERFSNLQSGQTATMDAPLVLELIAETAAAITPKASSLLDIGCGAGNFTLKLLERLPLTKVTLVDLSGAMLAKATERIGAAYPQVQIVCLQGDVLAAEVPKQTFDVAVAAASLHHLREDEHWRRVFTAVRGGLRAGGSFWISDLVEHDDPRVQALQWARYGEYLAALGGAAYRDKVFAYVQQEDTPRSLPFQLDLLRSVGFKSAEVLHKRCCFAAFGGLV